MAKSLVHAKYARRALVQVSYAIGVAEPMSVFVDTYGTGDDRVCERVLKENFDMRAGMLVKSLNLKRAIYQKSAAYGHFGRNDPDFTWETVKALPAPPAQA